MKQISQVNPWMEYIDEAMSLISRVADVEKETLRSFIEIPPDRKLGDLACTIAFHLAKERRRNPNLIAEDIVSRINEVIESDEEHIVEKAESKGPYINLFFKRSKYASRTIERILSQGTKYGTTSEFQGKRALIEFPAVNPSKPWHIGHTRNAVLGDTLCNVLQATGWEVVKLDYINDLGLQIAQLVWKLMKQKGNSSDDVKYDHYLGRMYVDVQKEFETNENVNSEIREVARRLEHPESEEAKVSLEMVSKCVKAQYQTAYRLGIFHDLQVWESDIAHSGLLDTAKKMMLQAENIMILEEGEKAGCVVAKLDVFDEFKDLQDPYKVLFRSDGTRTYTGADVALQMWKFGILKDPFRYQVFEVQPNGKEVYRTSLSGAKKDIGKFDAVFNVIGAPQAHPQRLIYLILELLGYKEQSENSHHISYEFVGLEETGFSGRKGTWIGYSTDSVIERATELAKEEVDKRNPDEAEDFRRSVAEKIGAGAVRYFLLNASPDRKITFRWKEALDFNGDSAPYLQYSLARATRILEKADSENAEPPNTDLLTHDAEFALVKALARFPEEVLETVRGLQKSTWGTSFQSNRLTSYSYNLATLFSKFYDTCPVLKAEKDLRAARLMLVKAFKTTIENCLQLLGIPIVERM